MISMGVSAFALFTGAASAQDNAPIPPLSARVTDAAGVLGVSAKQELEAKLAAFEQATGGQLAVLVVKTAEPETIDQYGVRVGDAWKVGKKGKDTGAILIVAMKEKKLRIEVGYGWEGALPDVEAKRIIREVITPYFKKNQYAQGIDAGIDKIQLAVAKENKAESTTVDDKGQWTQSHNANATETAVESLIGIAPVLLGVLAVLSFILRASLWAALPVLAPSCSRVRCPQPAWPDFSALSWQVSCAASSVRSAARPSADAASIAVHEVAVVSEAGAPVAAGPPVAAVAVAAVGAVVVAASVAAEPRVAGVTAVVVVVVEMAGEAANEKPFARSRAYVSAQRSQGPGERSHDRTGAHHWHGRARLQWPDSPGSGGRVAAAACEAHRAACACAGVVLAASRVGHRAQQRRADLSAVCRTRRRDRG